MCSFSTAALIESPASISASHFQRIEAGSEWRGSVSARQSKKVRPQPSRRPRLEQNTRCPRRVRPLRTRGSLPKERLCRFRVPLQPQCGQGDCLREKAWHPTHWHREENERANGTSHLAARVKPGWSRFFLMGLQRRD